MFAAVEQARRDGRDQVAELIPMLENNPVMAAYAAVQHGRPATELVNGRAVVGGEREPQAALEWDVWVDPDLSVAWLEDPSEETLDRIVDSMVIAHGAGVADVATETVVTPLANEVAQAMGLDALEELPSSVGLDVHVPRSGNYRDVASLEPWELGGVTPETWLGDFDRALALSGAVNLGAQLGQTGASEVRPDALGATYSERTGGDRLRLVLDLKSDASYLTPELVGAVAGRLEERYGLEVAAVASFSPDQLVGTGTDQVLFFNGAGNLQAALADPEERAQLQGRTAMFNGGSLLDEETRRVQPGVIAALTEAATDLDLRVGLYVQEGAAPRWAVEELRRLTAESPGLFAYGFAFGGGSDRVATGIPEDETGLGSQDHPFTSSWNVSSPELTYGRSSGAPRP